MSFPQPTPSDHAPAEPSKPVSQVSEARASRSRSIVISVVIASLAAAALFVIFNTEPKAERGGAVKKSAMLVEVTEAEFGVFRPRLVSTGTVEAAQDVVLSPEVTGRVTKIHPQFVPGGFVKAGQRLVSIHKADFLNAIAQRKSDLQTAVTERELERGRQEVARAEYQRLGEQNIAGTNSLALRKPQFDAARQRVEAAKMALKNAQLALRRTDVRAPFDAHVIRRDVNIGSQVSPGAPLARLVGIDHYWVIVTVPLQSLRWLDIPDDGELGSLARVRNRSAWAKGEYRRGRVARLIGAVEADSRMARVVVTIDDPLARNLPDDPPKLIVGEYLEVEVVGKELPEGAKLPREYVRADDTVWVMKDGKLNIRDVDVTMRDIDHAYIRTGLSPGDQIVTSNLSTVREGASLRLQSEKPSESSAP